MPIRSVVFDLFDTLVDLRWEQIPPLEHQGVRLPASTRVLYGEVARHNGDPHRHQDPRVGEPNAVAGRTSAETL